MPAEYLYDYQYRQRYSNFEHVYRVRGKHGAVFLWWYKAKDMSLVGGLEIASLTPDFVYGCGYPITSWAVDGQRCWVDGQSTYAVETLAPMAIALQPDHDAIFEMVRQEYDHIFQKRESND